jgi:hypothetical protein
MRCPVPARASYRDLLRDLLGRSVTLRPGPAQVLDPARPSYLAEYRFDDGGLAALTVADLELSAAMGAAIAAMPPQETQAMVAASGELDDELQEFLHEVVNVTAKLMNSPTTPHVVLAHLSPVPGQVAEDVAGLATRPRAREDWQVSVDGYGTGLLTIVS